jgi:hypothetical protein
MKTELCRTKVCMNATVEEQSCSSISTSTTREKIERFLAMLVYNQWVIINVLTHHLQIIYSCAYAAIQD